MFRKDLNHNFHPVLKKSAIFQEKINKQGEELKIANIMIEK